MNDSPSVLDRFPGLPPVFLVEGPWGLLAWQLLAFPVLAAVSVAVGALLARIAKAVFGRIAARSETRIDDALVARARGPLKALFAVIVAGLLLPLVSLPVTTHDGVTRGLRALALLAVFWLAWRVAEIGRTVVATSPWAAQHPSAGALVPLVARVLKAVIAALAIVALLSELGYPVASLLAGLGIGGLALALGAQKTLENLFGAFSIGADQPFREKDFVRVDDFVATVEEIGLRTTRFRTLDRTLVSIPNGKLADMRLETFAVRDRIRLACEVGVVYETTAAQMRRIIEGLEGVLRAHPKIWPDAVIVRFKELGPTSLNIEVMAWFLTSDWNEFQGIRQEILLSFMEVVEKAGSAFAFPTQTVHVVPAASAAHATTPDYPAGATP